MKKWFKYVKPYLPYFILGPLCMIVEVIGEILMPKFLAIVINNGAKGVGIGIGMGALMVLCMPCVLGFTVLSNVQILGLSIMDFEDFLVSQILLPTGSLIFAIFCVCRYGWGWKNFNEEANTGNGLKVQGWMRWYMTWVVPVIIAFIFFYGLYNFFK